MKDITIRNAELINNNFSGRSNKYNREGKRSFGVVLSDRLAEDLARRGFFIKRFKDQNVLRVHVPFIPANPGFLDWEDYADIVITPGDISIDGKHNYVAYLRSIKINPKDD